MLTISGVHKKYAGSNKAALEDISLTMKKGEILALTGESGCGKTTLLRSIAGFETIEKGKISINGEIVDSPNVFVSPEKRNTSLVFQDLALFPHMTVEKNIGYGLWKLTKFARKKRLEEMLDLTALSGYGKRYPHELSGGQQQRVALARALAIKPDVLLMDEPFSNLDELLKIQVRHEIKSIIKQSNTTTILVTHDAEDAFDLAENIAILRDGKLLQKESALKIYENPVNPYVGRFFGEFNILEGTFSNGMVTTRFGTISNLLCQAPKVQIGVRPQDLIISEKEEALQGNVSQIHFKGDHYDLIVTRDNSGEHLHLKLPNADLKIGDLVNISVNSEALKLFY